MSVLDNLKKSIARDRLSHAYLFIGEKGVGKLNCAKTFAKLLYCQNENKPCGLCISCKQIEALKHPNVLYISPEGQNIKKEQIDRLEDEFSKSSLIPGKRIYIIDQADRMNTTSANRLLKFIEEPVNKDTIGILISENYAKILPTIVSRCQVLLFPSLTKKAVEEKLLEQGYSEALAHLIPYLSSNPDEAIAYIEKNSILDIIELIKSLGKAFIENESMVLYFNSNLGILYDNPENLGIFMKLIIVYFMDILYVKNGVKEIAFYEEEQTLKKIARKNSEEALLRVMDILLDCSCKLNYNVNQVLLIERALLEIERG